MCQGRVLPAFSNYLLLLATQGGSLSHVRILKDTEKPVFKCWSLTCRPRACQGHRSCVCGLGSHTHSVFHAGEDSGARLICGDHSHRAFAGASQSLGGKGKPQQRTLKRMPLIPKGALTHCCRENCPPVSLETCYDQHQTQLDKQKTAASFFEIQIRT